MILTSNSPIQVVLRQGEPIDIGLALTYNKPFYTHFFVKNLSSSVTSHFLIFLPFFS